MEALGGAGFTHYAVSNHYFLRAVVQVDYVKNPVSLSKNIFSASNFFMHRAQPRGRFGRKSLPKLPDFSLDWAEGEV